MIIYKPFDMHTHTIHSDGQFTLEALCAAAKKYEYAGIALTDHNTESAFDGLPEVPVIDGVSVIRGIEWTTFFGHMQMLYADRFIDWRYAKPETIDFYTEAVKAANGIVGIAHPFEIGSPMCTGCFFDFKVKDWNHIDYIEVWSKEFPTRKYWNLLSFKMWTDLLNQGYRIAITAGSDWHSEPHKRHTAATYIGLEEGIISPETVRDAIRNGRTYLTCGPGMDISLWQNGQQFMIGRTIAPGKCSLSVRLDRNERKAVWGEFGIEPRRLLIVMNGEPVCSADCAQSDCFDFSFEAVPGWLRVEVYGDALGEADKQIGLSGAFYCR